MSSTKAARKDQVQQAIDRRAQVPCKLVIDHGDWGKTLPGLQNQRVCKYRISDTKKRGLNCPLESDSHGVGFQKWLADVSSVANQPTPLPACECKTTKKPGMVPRISGITKTRTGLDTLEITSDYDPETLDFSGDWPGRPRVIFCAGMRRKHFSGALMMKLCELRSPLEGVVPGYVLLFPISLLVDHVPHGRKSEVFASVDGAFVCNRNQNRRSHPQVYAYARWVARKRQFCHAHREEYAAR